MFLSSKTRRKTVTDGSRKTGRMTNLILLALLAAGGYVAAPASFGSTPTPSLVTIPGSNIPESEMENFEKKLLQRTFENDTVDKRLQRLELLVFGATQFGPVESRWLELKQNLAQSQKGKVAGGTAHKAVSAGQSQAIAQIEKNVLKKTFPTQTTAQRLDQLESKVFGSVYPQVPAEQRIDRLRKTIGMADPSESPRTAIQPFEVMPGRNFSHRMIEPGNDFFMRNLDPQTSQMLQEMDAQMRQLQNFRDAPRDGSEVHDFQSPDGTFRYHFEFRGPKDLREHVTPSQPKTTPKIPGLKTLPPGYVPPYGDPNSI